MANYNPEPIEFAVMDYNPNQYNFGDCALYFDTCHLFFPYLLLICLL